MGSKIGVLKVAAGRLGLTLAEYEDRRANGLKACTRCKAWKPFAAFDRDVSRGDALTAQCSDCRRVQVRRERVIRAPSKADQQGAVDAVRHAVKMGRMEPAPSLPCLDCGKPAAQYHHHLGYDRRHRLDVVALCRRCHQRRHWAG